MPPSVFYPLIRVLSPHPCFSPPHPCLSSIRVLSPRPCFIPPSVFYPPIRVLSPHPYPCFIPSSVFYSLTRVLFPHPGFIPVSVPPVSVSVLYLNPEELIRGTAKLEQIFSECLCCRDFSPLNRAKTVLRLHATFNPT